MVQQLLEQNGAWRESKSGLLFADVRHLPKIARVHATTLNLQTVIQLIP